ncbi:hypothetical protein AAF712_013778 [Marasmius tenuissimus]|uniref:F-box domain-containing protein n=1 Tax=Marasmius tenuissimus TaxID=585030 RepID=A0ABR2ZDQ4_9AGAR|nr:hypothetical protein PM082_013797 [Marasmius tenuissimus]
MSLSHNPVQKEPRSPPFPPAPTPSPLNIPELRRHTLHFLPRSDLMAISQVSRLYFSTATELLQPESHLNLWRKDRHIIWEHLSSRTIPARSLQYATVHIDVCLNPGEVFAALLVVASPEIRVAKFSSSRRKPQSWAVEFGQVVFETIVSRLSNTDHFILGNIPTRFQWILMHAAHGRITTLELHSSPFHSRLYNIHVVQLPLLQTLHLFHSSDYDTSVSFLTRVVQFLRAPNLVSFTLGSCLAENRFTVRETVEHFGHRLNRLLLLDEHDPSDDDNQESSLPSLPHVQGLEMDITWASLFLGNVNPDTFPSLHTLVFHGNPPQIMSGMKRLDWTTISTSLEDLKDQLTHIRCCYRSRSEFPGGTFIRAFRERLQKVGFELPQSVILTEDIRDPLPVAPEYEDGPATSWGTTYSHL